MKWFFGVSVVCIKVVIVSLNGIFFYVWSIKIWKIKFVRVCWIWLNFLNGFIIYYMCGMCVLFFF